VGAHDLAGRAVVLEVDRDALDELARRYPVSSLPRFCVFEAGRRVRPRAGAIDARQLERFAVAPPSSPQSSRRRHRPTSPLGRCDASFG